jgi:hypothetical protein
MDFLEAWASHARQCSAPSLISLSPSFPGHNRSLLSPAPVQPSALSLSAPRGYQLTPELAVSKLPVDMTGHAAEAPCSSIVHSTRVKMFHFPRESVERMKAVATQGPQEGSACLSSNDVISALMLRVITRARQVPDHIPIMCGYAADGRRRMHPPLPSGYFGNANFVCLACFDSALHVKHTLSFQELSLTFRSATKSMTTPHLQECLQWINTHTPQRNISKSFHAFRGNDLSITNWTAFGLYALDFGFRRPIYAGIPPLTAGLAKFSFDGIMTLTTSHDGSTVAIISLLEDHMARLEVDPLLREYAPVS